MAKLSLADTYKNCVTLAVLDKICNDERFIMHIESDTRVFNFWNGAGDLLDIAFAKKGVIIRDFDHESKVSPYRNNKMPAGLYDEMPEELHYLLLDSNILGEKDEKRLFSGKLGAKKQCLAAATFCSWWYDNKWHSCNVKFPKNERRYSLFGQIEDPQIYIEDFGDIDEDREKELEEAIAHIIAHKPLTDEIIYKLNPEASVEQVLNHAQELGYGRDYPM